MPFTKAKNYKHFNVGQYMRKKRLDCLAIEKSSRKAKNIALKRTKLAEKVRNVYIFYFQYENLQYFELLASNISLIMLELNFSLIMLFILLVKLFASMPLCFAEVPIRTFEQLFVCLYFTLLV